MGDDGFRIRLDEVEGIEKSVDEAGAEIVTVLDSIAGMSVDAGRSTGALERTTQALVSRTGLAVRRVLTTIETSAECRAEYLRRDANGRELIERHDRIGTNSMTTFLDSIGASRPWPTHPGEHAAPRVSPLFDPPGSAGGACTP